ncbi:MAG: O-antigen ligase family protein [Flavobacteriaceae bacterium]|nr:O-antigen ligase family protein [Flavobacteriaceae bacterium]
MWVFFIGSVFFYFYACKDGVYKKLATYILVLITIESLIVILQNMGVIPFLFSRVYEIGYNGFLSGTFGPNKIVLGMTMLISFSFVIGLLYESKLKISKILLFVALFGSIISIMLSGSRTTYVGLIIFLLYFIISKTGKFLNLVILGSVMFVLLMIINPVVFERINDTINNRIVDRIESHEDIQSVDDMTGVYEDLGSGRSDLHLMYVNHLLKRPYIIPFGIGFNNRLLIGSSAHNMYLSLINEVGIFGLILFLRWMFSFLIIKKRKLPYLQLALNGIVLSMFVTLYFGEHLYVYRPLFGILGYFMIICVLLLVPLRKTIDEK